MSNELEKAIRFFKNMRDDNKIVLDSDFGMKKGESNLLYKNRKKYAELAIDALEKQIRKKVERYSCNTIGEMTFNCPSCNLEYYVTDYEDFNYSNSYDSWNMRGIYTYVKSNNPKMIFNMMRIGNYGEYTSYSDQYANQPNIASYNYINPVITTINNLPEEVEKTEDYTMKITYRVSWSDPD